MKAWMSCVVVLMAALGMGVDMAAASEQLISSGSRVAFGYCQPIPTPVVNRDSAEYHLSAAAATATYLNRVEKVKVYGAYHAGSYKVIVVQGPQHGRLVDEDIYYPNDGYVGKDSITFSVEIGGMRVKAVYFLEVVARSVGNENYTQEVNSGSVCPSPSYWKISSTLNANGKVD